MLLHSSITSMSTPPRNPSFPTFHPFPLHHPSTSDTYSPPPPPPVHKHEHEQEHKQDALDGSSIEVVKRPRGRPPGSRNKAKPPAVVTNQPAADALRPLILEIPAGHDVTTALSLFSRRRDLGLAVLAGTGAISNVSLRQPSAAAVTLRGRFELLSVSATFLPPSFSASSPLLPSSAGVFSVSLAGPEGQVLGGLVAGPLVAAGTVTVVAASFTNPSFHRLPIDEELSVSVSVSVSVDGGRSGELEANEEYPHRRAAEMTGTSSHLLSDVIWARGQHTPPY